MTIDAMIDALIEREGGYVNHPNDRGGPTNFGVTQKTLSGYIGRAATIQEVKSLNRELAEEIYRRNYYAAPRVDRLPDEVQPFVFDMSINHGPRRAIKIVQQVCNEAGFPAGHPDGACGPGTQRAAKAAQDGMRAWFLGALVEARRQFFLQIVKNDPKQKVFLKGWLAHRVTPFIPAETK